jgi:hypothetical protein
MNAGLRATTGFYQQMLHRGSNLRNHGAFMAPRRREQKITFRQMREMAFAAY